MTVIETRSERGDPSIATRSAVLVAAVLGTAGRQSLGNSGGRIGALVDRFPSATMTSHDELLARQIIPWARDEDNVVALAELGSRVHDSAPDEWGDLDLLIVVRDASLILESEHWIGAIAPHWIALKHPGPAPGLPVRQILFDGALDFDIVPVTSGSLEERLRDPVFKTLLGEGFRVLIDKEGELGSLPRVEPPSEPSPSSIARDDFDFVVRDFLFQLVWATKHLRRGELWSAKDDVDCYMRGRMAQMIEWHTISKGESLKTSSSGRRIEFWADKSVLAALPPTFVGYESEAIGRALLASADLFRILAQESATRLGFSYPSDSHAAIVAWMETTLAPLASDSAS